MCYCENQRKIEKDLLASDIVVVNASSMLLPALKERVKRVIVDESHEVLACGKGGEARRFVQTLQSYPNVKHVWLVSGTPFGNSESIDDQVFMKQMQALVKMQPMALKQRDFSSYFKTGATVVDVKAFVMRMQKKQTLQLSDGTSRMVMPMPEIEYNTLEVDLNPLERELYDIAACVDAWKTEPFKQGADLKDLNYRFELRKLLIGERIVELKEELLNRLGKYYFVPNSGDSGRPDIFFARKERMLHRIEACCASLSTSSGKIDAVLNDISAKRQTDPMFKAIVVAEGTGVGRYIKFRLGAKAGVMQRVKGRTSVKQQKELIEFQKGAYEVIVCSFESVKVGTNMEQAGAIYFIESSFSDTEYKQACARIARCGTRHSALTATFVYVKDTISELTYKYHEDRRNGKSMADAAKHFEGDDPHLLSSPHDVVIANKSLPFRGMVFSSEMKKTDLVDLFTSDMDIDEAFEIICDASRNSEQYEISLVLFEKKRPAFYDVASQIIVTDIATGGNALKARFDVPQWNPASFDTIETLRAQVTLKDVDAKIMNDTSKWATYAYDGVAFTMLLKDGTTVDLLEQMHYIKASCSCCRLCGWRVVHNYEVPFVGTAPSWRVDGTGDAAPNAKILKVESVDGLLKSDRKHVHGWAWNGMIFHPVTDDIQAISKLARAPTHATPLHYTKVTQGFFECRKDVYAKAWVKLSHATVGDTITFGYKKRTYEVFLSEKSVFRHQSGDLFAVTFVVDKAADAPILIGEHEMLKMQRATKVDERALSIKDIVRMVRDDSEKTTKLKRILSDATTDDAEKQKLAAELV
jgi:hypothetical protein